MHTENRESTFNFTLDYCVQSALVDPLSNYIAESAVPAEEDERLFNVDARGLEQVFQQLSLNCPHQVHRRAHMMTTALETYTVYVIYPFKQLIAARISERGIRLPGLRALRALHAAHIVKWIGSTAIRLMAMGVSLHSLGSGVMLSLILLLVRLSSVLWVFKFTVRLPTSPRKLHTCVHMR